MIPFFAVIAWMAAAEPSPAPAMTAEQAGLAARGDLSSVPELAGRTIEVVEVQPNPEGVCPGPKRVDAPLPGYRATLRAGTRTYLVLVGEKETRVCFWSDSANALKPTGQVPMLPPPGRAPKKRPSPTPTASPSGSPERPEAAAARQALAERLGGSAEQVSVVTFVEVTWPDASLGCPRPGMVYAQVLKKGYRIVVEKDGQQFEYHGAAGGPPQWCSTPQPPVDDLR